MRAGPETDVRGGEPGVAGPWTQGDVIAVLVAQLAGLCVAYFAAWIAFFALPAEGLFSQPNSATHRLAGATAAVVAAGALPAGCWEAWRRRRHPAPAAVGALVGIAVLVLSLAWALQLT